MKVKELIDKLNILEQEIIGCDNLINFYKQKKIKLTESYNKLLKMDINNVKNI